MLRESWLTGRRCSSFTLQWHLTNECRFNCAHCYDRSDRTAPDRIEALRILEDLLDFCRKGRVAPHVCLTGGDPLLYPDFWYLYGELKRRRITVSLLGNPLSTENLARLLQAGPPKSYQVSLEGLEATNDRLRGRGHFSQCLSFLEQARRRGLNTHVMLTLSSENIAQVLPLAEQLRGLASRFTFNRLCQVSGGASLQTPSPTGYRRFLEDYLRAGTDNPLLGFKDNLFNILRESEGGSQLGGCTGFGCGAAFNFLALLPDGEVHACRKFPSLLGHVNTHRFADLYASPRAKAYRRGPTACQHCKLQQTCRGCMAVTHGKGLSPLEDCDPDCFRLTRL